MKSQFRRRSLIALIGLAALPFSTWAQAQILDTPVTIDLPFAISPGEDFEGIPSTHNIGEIDPSVVTDIGGLPLNDIVILTNSQPNPTPEDRINRVYTITHTSGSNTQALSAPPAIVDIAVSDFDPECFFDATSVQILDLTGDGISDLAFAGENCFAPFPGIKFFGSIPQGNVFGIQGQSGTPFFNASNTVLGLQTADASIPDPAGQAPLGSDFSQPALASADFNNNGLTDLAFYNFNDSGPDDLIQVLENNGSMGTLPTSANVITGPFAPPDNLGVNILAGDFNGDGNQDVALTFIDPSGAPAPTSSRLTVYSGNGDGTFAPTPIVNEVAGVAVSRLHSLASGDFDGNSFLDFVTMETDAGTGIFSQVYIVTCSPGSPNPTCSVAEFDIDTITQNVGVSATTGDFDGDGLDDIALSYVFDGSGETPPINTGSQVNLYLNNGGSFDGTPDQTFNLSLTPGRSYFSINQVIAADIDTCGGPDLSFIGFGGNFPIGTITFAESITQGGAVTDEENQAAVAFNPNEAPVADAGPDNGTKVNGNLQLGGSPTCSDPTNDFMEISWTQLSGQTATLNDPTAANPIIVSASGTANATFQVTCTDACGLSDSDTVTIDLGLLEGSGISCSLNPAMAGGGLSLWSGMMLLATGAWALWRARHI